MKDQSNSDSNLFPSTNGPPAFYLENLGCSKNQVDAEIIIQSLTDRGYSYTTDPEKADFFIVNTCGFIRSAKEESFETVLAFKQQYPDRPLVIAGCVAQRYGEELTRILPEADAVFGNNAPSRIVEIVEELRSKKQPVFLPPCDSLPVSRNRFLSFPGSVYVKIAEGCDNRCSYCAIPLIRGDLRSRRPDDIVREIADIVAQGNFEINLVAQDLGSYGKDLSGSGLSSLLDQILNLEGDFWVRLLYMHPDHFPFDILEQCRKDPRLLPYFDIPFQHASEKILRAMGRKGSAEKHMDLLDTIRQQVPNAVFRSTFLLGFPGETDKDFEMLLDFQSKAMIDWVGSYTYSPEEGTRAFEISKGITAFNSKRKAEKRQKQIEENQKVITETLMARFIGQSMRVLVEEEVQGEDLFLARGYPHAPEVDGMVVVHAEQLAPGVVQRVKIIKVNGIDMEAVIE
jgi:ribosomal protein S12 methylthiotransferase